MGRRVRGCAWEEVEEGLPGCGFWGWRRGVSGDLCRNAPLQDQLGQAAGGRRGTSRGKGVTQTQSARSHRGAGTCPHGAGCVGEEGRLRTEKHEDRNKVRKERHILAFHSNNGYC